MEEEKAGQLEKMCDFAAIWHTTYFLRSTLLSIAPKLDLNFLKDMKELKKYDVGLASTVRESLFYHSYYLTEELVPVALVDKTLKKSEKEALAAKIYFSANSEKPPSKPKLRTEVNDGDRNYLCEFAGEGSWKLFNDIGICDQARDWLQLPASEWEEHGSFRALEHFVKSLACVNDSSERKIKLIQDYVLSAKSEEKRQNILFSAHQNRTILKYDEMTKEIMTCYFNGQQCCIQGRAKVHYPPPPPPPRGGPGQTPSPPPATTP